MAGTVGGIVWLPFLLAFIVATLTAFSYLELVTQYPQAAGAALYTHKAFGIHFVTFLVAFAVVCSGITSASTSANVLAQNFFGGLEVNGWMGVPGQGVITAVAMGFMLLLAAINLRGVGESVKFNVVLTLVEMTALCIVIGVGFYVMAQGTGNLGEITVFNDYQDKGLFLAVTAATSIAFFAMVGFEDSVNMVEETQNPEKIFPRTMLTGLGIAVILYMLVAVSVVSVLSPTELEGIREAEGAALLEVVHKGSPDFPIDRIFPFLAVFAVANTALINMLMASRLIYGMARQNVLPRPLGKVLPGRRTPWAGIAVLHRPRAGADLVRHQRPEEQHRGEPLRHDGVPAAVRLHRGERGLPGAPPQAGPQPQGVLHLARAAAARGGPAVCLPRRPVGGPARHPVPDRRGPDGDRRRAVVHHLADQQEDQHPAGRTGRHAEHRQG